MRRGKILFLIVSLVFEASSWALTRDEVLENAAIYAGHPWSASSDNILDVYDHVNSTSSVPKKGSDGRDDRAYVWDVENSTWVYSTALWPFVVGSTVTGEAYTWGGWKGNLKWGAETTGAFHDRLIDTSYKWIAGGRKKIEIPAEGETIVPVGYKGYAGIDCSGLVGNALDINKLATDKYKFNSTQLIGNSLQISTSEVKLGDFVGQGGDHVALFVEWIDAPRTARILHASYRHFSEGDYKYRVVWDSATLTGNNTVSETLPARPQNGYGIYSAFPQFAWGTPTKDNPELDPLVPVIELCSV